VVEVLLGFIRTKPGSIWEPACGEDGMVKVLEREFRVLASDIETAQDFLSCAPLPSADIRGIVTNPPYALAQSFCEHALGLTKPTGGFVAMLLRTDFDHAARRKHLFGECPPFARKIVLTKRIVWFVEENGKPKASPSENHAWFIWDWRHVGSPVLSYAP
jgi:hypothetical protein